MLNFSGYWTDTQEQEGAKGGPSVHGHEGRRTQGDRVSRDANVRGLPRRIRGWSLCDGELNYGKISEKQRA